MRLIITILALAFAAVGLSFTLELYGLRLGWMSAEGLPAVPVSLWALIGAVGAVLLGFVSRYLERRVPRPASWASNIAIALGLVCGALTLAVPFVFSG